MTPLPTNTSRKPRGGREAQPRLPSWTAQVWLVAKKDFAIELSTREILTTSGFFAVLITVIASLAFYSGADAAQTVAPGTIWVAVAFASVLALGRTWQREREDDALLGLLASPLARSALFAGKALGVMGFIFAVEALVLPVVALLFDVDLGRHGLSLAWMALAATPGIAASGTLFGAMTARTRARELVLASVLFPLQAPTLLAAVAGTKAALAGAPAAELLDYAMLMAVFALVFTAGGLAMFETLLDA